VLLILTLSLLASCGVEHGDKRYHVPSPAMEPTFKQDTAVTAKTVKAGGYQPADGDVVIFRVPAGWGLSGGDLLLRRVVGIPGETIECCGGTHGQLKRNGKWADEPYLSETGQSNSFAKVTVPAGELYVMEDNRGKGADSALKGTIRADSVTGVVEPG
jgi:signal peptidase I